MTRSVRVERALAIALLVAVGGAFAASIRRDAGEGATWRLALVERAAVGEWSGRDFDATAGPLAELVSWVGAGLAVPRAPARGDLGGVLAALLVGAWLVVTSGADGRARIAVAAGVAILAVLPGALGALLAVATVRLHRAGEGPPSGRRALAVASATLVTALVSFGASAIAMGGVAASSLFEAWRLRRAGETPRPALARLGLHAAALLEVTVAAGLVIAPLCGARFTSWLSGSVHAWAGATSADPARAVVLLLASVAALAVLGAARATTPGARRALAGAAIGLLVILGVAHPDRIARASPVSFLPASSERVARRCDEDVDVSRRLSAVPAFEAPWRRGEAVVFGARRAEVRIPGVPCPGSCLSGSVSGRGGLVSLLGLSPRGRVPLGEVRIPTDRSFRMHLPLPHDAERLLLVGRRARARDLRLGPCSCTSHVDLVALFAEGRARHVHSSPTPKPDGIFLHPNAPSEDPAAVEFSLRPCANACVSMGLRLEGRGGDGVTFRVAVEYPSGRRRLLNRDVLPGQAEVDVVLPLGVRGGEDATLRFATLPRQAPDFDWASFVEPRLRPCPR